MAAWARIALCAGLASCSHAMAQALLVEAVQSPAWLERGGRSVPLAPGLALQRNDRVLTGAEARVELRLAEGSSVKLGERAQFVVERAGERRGLKAAFAVLAGAFRFATSAVAPAGGRDVSVRVKNVTVGIRGTDVWGKSSDERDLVCLIEGRVTVAAAGHPPVILARPRDYYQKPAGAAPQVDRVDEAQLAAWSQETEMPAAAGQEWSVVAANAADRESARILQRRLRAAGFPAEIVAGEGFLQLHITGFASEARARAVMGNVRAVPGITLPKVVGSR